ncbi:MAG: VOC family protein [Burkholderiaceae bacterium]
MPHPIPYLSFDGNCADAMRFYERALGGKLEAVITNRQTPYAAQTPEAQLDRVMHAYLALPDGGSLYAGDSMSDERYAGMQGVMIALTYDTVADAERVFAALSEGGKVTMPLGPTFWAKTFGMLVDRFGTPWGINGESIQQPGAGH